MSYRPVATIILLLFLVSGLHASEMQAGQNYILVKPELNGESGFSGDRQHGMAGETVNPLRARVVNRESEPVVGIPVIFEVIRTPPGGDDYQIERKMVPTDSSGMAVVNFTLGSAGGEYQIIARIRSAATENVQVYTLFAREKNWWLFLFVGLVGGLALFLLGLDIMSRGILRSAGDKMRSILGSLTGNRLKALGLGAFMTMAIQSSSATNVMMVSFVNAGLMKFRQTIGVVLGAAIGTTITAQLIAFRLTDLSLLFVATGFAVQVLAKKQHYKHTGEIILGFGMLFFGMDIMSEAMYPLRSYDPFLQMLLRLEYPLLGILVGAVFTALIQSSSAFVGIMIILGTQGLISLEASIPLLFGANIGTAGTALLAGISAKNEARRVALAITIFKVFGVLLFVWWITPFASLIEWLSPESGQAANDVARMAEVVPRQIANAHTVYNVFVALLLLPFTGLIAVLTERLLPAKKMNGKPELNVHYLDESVLKTPVMALSLAKQEVIRMGNIVYEMVDSVLPVFLEKNRSVFKELEIKEKKVNFLRDQINSYLLRITRAGIREERVNEAFQMLYTVKELELMADAISSALSRKALNWLDTDYSFSKQGELELTGYHEKTCKQISRALEVFSEVNTEKAVRMEEKYRKYRSIAFELEKHHYERLKLEDRDTLMSSRTHLEIMTMLKNISSHATNIARILLQWKDSGEEQSGF